MPFFIGKLFFANHPAGISQCRAHDEATPWLPGLTVDLLRLGELCHKLPVHEANRVDHEVAHARIEELLFGVTRKPIRLALYDLLQGKDWMKPIGHGHTFN